MAQAEEVPGAIGQGPTRHEARANVTDAPRLMLKPDPNEIADPDRSPSGGRSVVPRHSEIGPGIAIAICKQLGVPKPSNPR